MSKVRRNTEAYHSLEELDAVREMVDVTRLMVAEVYLAKRLRIDKWHLANHPNVRRDAIPA